MSVSSSIRDTFFEECQDLLEAMDEGLQQINDGERDKEVVNAVFRAVHSIKGGAGAFALDDLVGFAHTFETVFDEVRSDRLELEDALIKVLFRAADHLVELVEAARNETESDATLRAEILGELQAYLGDEPEEEVTFEPMGFEPGGDFALDLSDISDGPVTFTYRIAFWPHIGLYKNGHEPFFLLRALTDLGEIEVALNTDALPDLAKLDPVTPYLAWDIVLTSEADEPAVREIFEFVEDLCDLTILTGDGSDDPEPDPAIPDDLSEAEPESAAAAPAEDGDAPDADEGPHPEDAEGPAKALEAKAETETKSKAAKPSLRVDPDRVDRLINTVGELIINQSMLAQRVSELVGEDRRELESELEDYKMLARDIQEGVMAIRAQPVKPLFRRMARIVREAANATGKSVRLETVGENTEVDKTVIEGLVDPLTHMIRNAVDHGIETPEKRRAAGKDDTGVITLSAMHRSGSVYIEIRDDGAGLNREKILGIAIEKGLVAEGASMTDGEIDNLLFLPGFSTASEVSNLSGRGVGMDVVKNAVVGLGGRTAISSETGSGTTFSVVLPLTLAVMDGMVVTIAGETMVVPISSIVETVRPEANGVHQLDRNERLLSIRGNFVPVVDIADRLGLARAKDVADEVFLLAETTAHGQTALAVDGIHDQRQVVVKRLEAAYGRIPGISAATILGDGKIAMIVDPDGIAQIAGGADPWDAPLSQNRELTHV